MSIATKDRCIIANTPELFLIAHRYSLHIAVYQVEPCSPLHYVLIQEVVGNPNKLENVVHLFFHSKHYQRIITSEISYSDNDHHILYLDKTPTDAHVSNDDCHKMDISVAVDQSYQDEFVMDQINKFTYINKESTSNVNQDLYTVSACDDLYCQMYNNDLNSIDSQALSTSGQSLNSTHEVIDESVFDEAFVANATIQEAANDPIINDAALAGGYKINSFLFLFYLGLLLF